MVNWSSTRLTEIVSFGICPGGPLSVVGSGGTPVFCENTFELIICVSVFSMLSLIIVSLTFRSPVPWLSCLNLEMKVQNDISFSVMIVLTN